MLYCLLLSFPNKREKTSTSHSQEGSSQEKASLIDSDRILVLPCYTSFTQDYLHLTIENTMTVRGNTLYDKINVNVKFRLPLMLLPKLESLCQAIK